VFPLLQRLQPSAPGAHERVLGNMDASAGWPPPLAVPMAKLALDCVLTPERRPTFARIAEVLRGHHSKYCGQNGNFPPAQHAPGGWQAAPPYPPQHVGYPPQQEHGWVNHPAPAPRPPQPPPQANGYRGAQDVNGHRNAPDVNGHRNAHDVNGHRNELNGNRNGSMPEQGSLVYGGATGSKAKRRDTVDETKQLAEIVLECTHGDGIDVSKLSPAQKSLVFVIKPGQKRLSEPLGRSYQADFLDRFVLREQQGFISRSHCELLWDSPDATPKLRKLTMNPILIDERMVRDGEAIPLQSGTRVGFMQNRESGAACFLSMKVLLRDYASVKASGPHPATALPPPGPQRSLQHSKTKPLGSIERTPSTGGLCTLECVDAAGMDLRPVIFEDKSIVLQIDVPVDVGRQHQVNFFDRLLNKEPRWLTFISRSHCRLTLERGNSNSSSQPLRVEDLAKLSAPTVRVENLSNNVIFVGDERLGKGHSGTLTDSGLLEFAAAPDGPNNIVKFLKFRLRRQQNTGRRNSQS